MFDLVHPIIVAVPPFLESIANDIETLWPIVLLIGILIPFVYKRFKKFILDTLEDKFNSINDSITEINHAVNNKGDDDPTLRELVVTMHGVQDVMYKNQNEFRETITEMGRTQSELIIATAKHSSMLTAIQHSLTIEASRLHHILKINATYETDESGMCTWVSRGWSDTTGVPMTQALGVGWVNAIHAEDRYKVVDEWERAIAEKRPFGPLVYRFVNQQTGKVIEVIGEATPVLNASDMLAGYVGSIKPAEPL